VRADRHRSGIGRILLCALIERATASRGPGQKPQSARERLRPSNASDSRAIDFGTSAGCVRPPRVVTVNFPATRSLGGICAAARPSHRPLLSPFS
jgi:hypothetical protein